MKVFTGYVISKKMDKTATVVVTRVIVHPVYKKRFKRIKKYHVHDEIGAKKGQKVKFVASRPFSKSKKWKMYVLCFFHRSTTFFSLGIIWSLKNSYGNNNRSLIPIDSDELPNGHISKSAKSSIKARE